MPRFLLWGYELVCANIAEVEGCVLFRSCWGAFLPSSLLGGCEYLLLLETVGQLYWVHLSGSERESEH